MLTDILLFNSFINSLEKAVSIDVTLIYFIYFLQIKFINIQFLFFILNFLINLYL